MQRNTIYSIYLAHLAGGLQSGHSVNEPTEKTMAEFKVVSSKDPKARYYDAGGIETLDILKAKLTPEQYKGWLIGNMLKYSSRANFKGCFDRDVQKAAFYSKELARANEEAEIKDAA